MSLFCSSIPRRGAGSSGSSAASPATRSSIALGVPSTVPNATMGGESGDAPPPRAENAAGFEEVGFEGERESHWPIEISDAMIDDNPFDPSYCDEEWYRHEQRLQRALQRSPPSPSVPSFRVSRNFPAALLPIRVFGAGGAGRPSGGPSSPGRSTRTGLPGVVASPSSPTSPWRMNFRHRRGSTIDAPLVEADEDNEGATIGIGHEHGRRTSIQEPGVLLSGHSPKKWGLVPLEEAQGRADIMRRAEGFEMREGRTG
jgi:hypothetical protein